MQKFLAAPADSVSACLPIRTNGPRQQVPRALLPRLASVCRDPAGRNAAGPAFIQRSPLVDVVDSTAPLLSAFWRIFFLVGKLMASWEIHEAS